MPAAAQLQLFLQQPFFLIDIALPVVYKFQN